MKLSFLTLILISSIVFATDEITISKAFIKMPRPGVDVTAGFATIKADIDLKVMKVRSDVQDHGLTNEGFARDGHYS